MRDDDPIDVGYIELPGKVVEQIGPHYRFASLSEIDVCDDLLSGYYLIHGFPKFLSETDEVRRTVLVEPMAYLTLLSDDKDEGYVAGRDIRVQYPKIGINPQREDALMKVPSGISGCGIWRIARLTRPDQWGQEDVKLVGIEHTFKPRDKARFLQGTRMRVVLEMIYRTQPSIRGIMDLHLGMLTNGW